MDNNNLFAQVRQLSKDYYNNLISFNDYRAQRNSLLKKIDIRYNGKD
ncbi:hypothetical protein [Aliikangiella sp. IMCC44359]